MPFAFVIYHSRKQGLNRAKGKRGCGHEIAAEMAIS